MDIVRDIVANNVISSMEFDTVDGVSLKLETCRIGTACYGGRISYASPTMALKAESIHPRHEWWEYFHSKQMDQWQDLDLTNMVFTEDIIKGGLFLSVSMDYMDIFRNEALQPLDKFPDVLSVVTVNNMLDGVPREMVPIKDLHPKYPRLARFISRKRFFIIFNTDSEYLTDYTQSEAKGYDFLTAFTGSKGGYRVERSDHNPNSIDLNLLDYIQAKVGE